VNLRRGDSGAAVAEVRSRLIHIGLLAPGTASDTFDDGLEHAVRTFQQERGLNVDGIVGKDTYRRLEEARWQLGDRRVYYVPGRLTVGDDVAEMQRRLNQLGFDAGRTDGFFGPQTDQALREFQRSVGIEVDGVCGPDTFLAFDRLTRAVSGGDAGLLRDQLTLTALRTGINDKVLVLHPGARVDADICWSIAERIEGRLAVLGTTVLLTHGKHAVADDETAAAFANDVSADLVVGIEVNWYTSPRPNGLVTFFYGDERMESVSGRSLAECIHAALLRDTKMLDGRCQPRTWDLLRLTRMPAVRVELGYLSHPGDAERLRDPAFHETVAQAIADAVTEFCAPPMGAAAATPTG
jgi:N-acetylmuramoyl-L-alanine amidase